MYYIYENWRAEKKAVIHKGTCKFCNEGKGTGKTILGESNGKWHGPYLNFEEAWEKANLLKDRDVRKCSFCIK